MQTRAVVSGMKYCPSAGLFWRTDMTPAPCEHHFTYIGSHKRVVDNGAYQMLWRRVERFYCTRCLEQRDIVKEEWSREAPDWYKDTPTP